MTDLKRCVGRSPDGARRVYGQDVTEAGAVTQARAAALDYLKGRPDCGPLSEWFFDLNASDGDMAAVQFARDVR
jgi:hypothetical protein